MGETHSKAGPWGQDVFALLHNPQEAGRNPGLTEQKLPASGSKAPKRLRSQLHQMTLFQRLLLVGIAMTIVVIGLAAYIGYLASASMEERISKDRLVAAQSAAAGLEALVHHAVLDLQVMAEFISQAEMNGGGRESADAHLRALVEKDSPTFESVLLLSPKGEAIAVATDLTSPTWPPGSSLIPPASSLQEGESYFSVPFGSPMDKNAHVAISVPVVMKNGESLGYLTGIWDMGKSPVPAYLSNATSVLHTGHADLLARDGRVIASTESAPLSRGDHPSYFAEASARSGAFIDIVPEEEEEAGHPSEDEGHLMALVPLEAAPWHLMLGGSASETFAPVTQFNSRMLRLAGFVLGFTIIGGVIGTAKLVHPVRVLSLSAKRLAGGDLSSPIAVGEGGEIGDLARDMDTMRVRMKTSLEEIQDLNRRLEERIAERTHLLERRNRELEAASDIAGKVSSSINLETVLHQTLESVAEATGQRSLAIFLMDREGKRLTLTAGLDLKPPFRSLETSVALGQCLCGQVAASGEVGQVKDISASLLVTRKACALAGYRCMVSYPLRSRDRIEGVLTIFSPEANSLAPHDYPVVTLICNQIGVAIQNARLYLEAMEKEKLAHQLLEKVINAQEEERKRLARELHDETGQTLTAIALSLEALHTQLEPGQVPAHEQLEALHQMTRDALNELRKMALALRPSALDDLGLVPAVRRYALQHLDSQGVAVSIEGGDLPLAMDPSIQTLLFRIVQEAINNVARHSKATAAKIRFWQEGDQVFGEVTDNGVGFDPDTIRESESPSEGLGLMGMQERAGLAGGAVAIMSTPGEGCRVLVRVPLKKGVAVS